MPDEASQAMGRCQQSAIDHNIDAGIAAHYLIECMAGQGFKDNEGEANSKRFDPKAFERGDRDSRCQGTDQDVFLGGGAANPNCYKKDN